MTSDEVYFRTIDSYVAVSAQECNFLQKLLVRLAFAAVPTGDTLAFFHNSYHPFAPTFSDLNELQSAVLHWTPKQPPVFTYKNTDLDGMDLVLNTVRVLGSPVVRAIARIFGKSETVIVPSENRGWLADIVREGVREGVLDSVSWGPAYGLLQSGRSQTVVVTRSEKLEKPKNWDGVPESWESLDLIDPGRKWQEYVHCFQNNIVGPTEVASHKYGHGLSLLDMMMPREVFDGEFEKYQARMRHPSLQREE